MPAPQRKGNCRLVSPGVAPEKDSKAPEWEVDWMTYSLDGNILNHIIANDLRKMTSEEKACFMSFYVRASDSRNGKSDARQLLREGI
jgi:hypothetical protein